MVIMKVEKTYKPDDCRNTAKNLLTEVSRLLEQAGKTNDRLERREIYLQAMTMSGEAYGLLGKARKLNEKDVRAEKRFSRAKETLAARG
jgi:hypothetical protein